MTNATGRLSQARGDFGEDIALRALQDFGVKMIEKVNTPWKVLWKNCRPVQAFVTEKVSGDFIGIGAGGKKVLAEVKYREDTLSLSDFKYHQIDKLEENSQLGGVSLVVWVQRHVCCIYWWPAMILKKGAPIKAGSPEEKQGLQLSINF
jgi:penicillin-binding protein-related factor A (putative recombinase)